MTPETWIGRLSAPVAEFGATDTGLRRRLRLLAGCLFLAVVSFHMAPGRLIAETKLDMPVNPIGFLAQALNMWDQDYLGHLQNQAYGYIFPMGPFYTLLINSGMPPWVVQRLWVTLILCAAFVGVAQVARALRIGGQLAGVLAGLAYALAPHAQALMGFNSVEFAPSAVLPWTLLFLIRGARGETSPRRAACLSALVFLFAGGINAAAELAVLVVPMIYLLTRRPGPRKRRLIAWWLGAIAAVSFWWLVPLVMLGRYVFSFMPFTENAWTTTVVGSLTNVLRGMNHWVAFLPVDGRPYLPAAYEHATVPWLVVVTALLAGLGLAGLTLARTPERPFLILTALAGVIILVAGHAGPLAEPIRALLDGPLAPFRNLHKFNALLRLPLVLGLAALVSHVGAARAAVRLPATVAVAALAGLTLMPVATAGIAPAGAFDDVPEHWRQAASWLDERADQGTVLVLPGARRGEYTWGRPLDEPFQPLLKKARWVSNTIVPWGTAGSNRLVKAIDDRFANGQGSAGLTQALRRMGVRHLLVRNDLDRVAFGDAWPARVHEALDRSPGLRRVRGFGPTVGHEESSTAGGWLDQPYASLEVYEVTGASPVVGTVPAARPLRVSGAPEALLTMAEEGVLADDRPVILGDDPGADAIPPGDTVLTDTMRRRELVVSDLRRPYTETMTPDEPYEGRGTSHDLVDPAWDEPRTVAVLTGVESVTASSSQSRLGATPGTRDAGQQPYAALDDDLRTGWRSTGWEPAVEQWLEVRLAEPVAVPSIQAAFERSDEAVTVSEVMVETDTGRVRTRLGLTSIWERLNVPTGKTSRIRIRVTGVLRDPNPRVGITEIAIPGVRAGRTLVVPAATRADSRADSSSSSSASSSSTSSDSSASSTDSPVDSPDPGRTVVTSRTDAAPGCMLGSYVWACADRLRFVGEDGYAFDRSVPVGTGRRVLEGRAVLADQRVAENVLMPPGAFPRVTASSTAADIPATGAYAAFDDDRRTVWYAGRADLAPTLTAELGRTMTLSRLRVDFPDTRLGAPPVRITVTTRDAVRYAWASRDGWIDFAPMRADRVEITFTALGSWRMEVLGVGIPGVRPLPALEAQPVRMPCGFGPTLTVNGVETPTEIRGGTLGDLFAGRPVPYRTCEAVWTQAGTLRVRAAPSQGFRVDSMVLRGTGDTGTTATRTGTTGTAAATGGATVAGGASRAVLRPAEVEHWDAGERRVRVSTTEPSYLALGENFNAGWRATFGGRVLEPARLDGWRQAWLLPPGDGTVVMTYAPDGLYRAALIVGWALVALVAALALARSRPAVTTLAAAPAARVRAAWLWPLVPLLGLVTEGWAGAALAGAVAALALWLRGVAGAAHSAGGRAYRIGRVLLTPFPVVAVLGAAGLALAYGGESGTVVAQYLCLVVLGLLFAAVRVPPPPRPWLRTPAEAVPARLVERR
ncbi:alpha-(1-_3)-arabinofuranosyltransferase family protein [Streptosporangium sp. NPDC023615]|uniref:alpha-(1->3)-arabinofuranosyltransferase domain-containing protein n=1 Tax=Streptosporangium sp. NPDC023615 TaxID=3154794 RepID=UPI003425D3BB